MEDFFVSTFNDEGMDRVDGKLKVTGAAKYSAEYDLPGLTFGVLVESTIAKGKITAINSKKAMQSPGVLAVISYINAPKVPGYESGATQPAPASQPHRVFYDDKVYFNGQPVVLVIADTFERATYAASLVSISYEKHEHKTDMAANKGAAVSPANKGRAFYKRGEENAYKNAEIKVEEEYIMPREVHNPMELHSIIAAWDGEDKVMVYEKTQGVKSTQNEIVKAFKLKEENVQVNAKFVGGGFGSALRTWPHAIAALIGAKVVQKPLKLVLKRDQMFAMVGYRPAAIQKIGIGATKDGKFTGITHEAIAETSTYEEFTEGIVTMSKFLYACPNVNTTYKVLPLDVSTPTWMRGPGEATGSFALECAIDELSYKLNMDPIQLRLANYAETDPEKNIPFSSKFLKECYQQGIDAFGWNKRKQDPGTQSEGEWLIGYGMSSGTFGAFRGKANVQARLLADGTLILQSAVSDSGPGTATAMTELASQVTGLPSSRISFELGDSSLPPGPTQGGSSTTSTLGSAVHKVCTDLKHKLFELAGSELAGAKFEEVGFTNGELIVLSAPERKISFKALLAKSNLPELSLIQSAQGGKEQQEYSMYSYSVHFTEVRVHKTTGVVRIQKVVTVGDAGKIVSEKAAANQMKGGVVGGIGMALMEEAIMDHRYGRYVNNNFADYHVPVHADVPDIQVIFINKPDPHTNPMGSKGLGEIALIGFAASVANAVYNATGKRIRELPITPDKVIA